MSEQELLDLFIQYSHQPLWLYGSIFAISILSAFGLPFPEELLIVTAGLAAHVSSQNQGGIELETVAVVTLFSVIVSDFAIYLVGRYLGPWIQSTTLFQKLLSEKTMSRVERWMQKYGFWTVALFRVTPGLRFAGFFSCGVTGVPPLRFFIVDATAATLLVPTQILLIGRYGEVILDLLKNFRTVFLILVCMVVTVFIIRKMHKRFQKKKLRSGGHRP